MKSATVSGTTSTYIYDGDGKRARKVVGSTTSNYVYDANRSLPVVLTDGTLKYFYGLGLAYAVDSNGVTQTYHTDGLGSVRAITDPNHNLIQTFQTDEFGVPALTQGTSTEPFRFTGQQNDGETGFYDLRARYYWPSLGRFVTRDPLAGSIPSPLSLNRFSYVQNNPIGLFDPSGLVNAVNRDSYNSGSTDNPCFSSAGGTFGGNIISIGCLNLPFGSNQFTLVWTPLGPMVVSFVAFATIPKGGTGDANDIPATGHGRERLIQQGWSLAEYLATKAANVFQQADGASVYVQRVGRNSHNVVVEGSEGVITSFKGLPSLPI